MTDIWYAVIPLAALVIDTVFGDPHSSLHPVVQIGRAISFFEKHLYPKHETEPTEVIIRGGATVILVLLTTYVVTEALMIAAEMLGHLAAAVMGAVVLYFTITPRALARDGLEIYHLLREGNIVSARARLSWIVGRDTDKLDENDIARGAVETIAENTTDGILSPLFYFLIFGPVGAALYRAANTMDSMLGYKNERYLYFGRFAARLDDVLNYIPARITFMFFVLAAAVLGLDWRNAWRIGLRDGKKHPSPNGGYAEGPMAGALHVRLGGWNYYEGKPEFREYMGDADRPLVGRDILLSLRVMYTATVFFILLETAVIWMG